MFNWLLIALLALAQKGTSRFMMYLTGQHNVLPEMSLVSNVTHVALAFMSPATFNQDEPSAFPLFTTVEAARSEFPPCASIMVAIGGWGDTEGFEVAAATDSSRRLFARNVRTMVEATGADGVDIDWEYPGGNGEDYKKVSNAEKAWEVDAYPLLLSELRCALGSQRLISAAVPGLSRDMLAFNKATIPLISASIDFLNIMTYDLMNRRDNVTKHHTGISLSLNAINAYEEKGLPPDKMNLGFAFYIKWFKTAPYGGCERNPIGCKTTLMEDPLTGADLGQAGAFSWHDPVPKELSASFEQAMKYGKYDSVHGGHYYWDSREQLWWSWDTPNAIAKKFPAIMEEKKLGGAFAWGLGEDADDFVHLKALTAAMERYEKEDSEATKGKARTAWLSRISHQDEL